MGRGSYLGGSTVIRVKGPSTGGGAARHRMMSTGPEFHKQKLLKQKEEQEARARIKANEKLVRKLSKQWIEEKGRKHFEELATERRAKAAASPKNTSVETARGNALALALERALSRRDSNG